MSMFRSFSTKHRGCLSFSLNSASDNEVNREEDVLAPIGKDQSMSNIKPVTMVMVDDNIDEIFLTRRQVRSQGIVNHFVSERISENLITTLTELYSSHEIDNLLILMDVSMPRMDGFETLKALRNHKKFKDLPVIMFSASADESDIAVAADLGADGYMVKPFKIESFIGALACLPHMRYHLVR